MLFSIVLCYCSPGTSSLSLSSLDKEANEATFAGSVKHLVKPCLDDLVANLIGQEDADGHILYEARESFELTPRRFKAIVAKVQHQLRALHQSPGQSHEKLNEYRLFLIFGPFVSKCFMMLRKLLKLLIVIDLMLRKFHA